MLKCQQFTENGKLVSGRYFAKRQRTAYVQHERREEDPIKMVILEAGDKVS